jgi:hypothetical protein
MKRLVATLSVLTISWFAGSRVTVLAQEDLTLIREAHRNSRQAIHSLHAVVTVAHTVPEAKPKQNKKGQGDTRIEWWESGGNIRWRVESKHLVPAQVLSPTEKKDLLVAITQQNLVKNGKLTMVAYESAPGKEAHIRANIKNFTPTTRLPHDVWEYALFTLIPNNRASLTDILDARAAPKTLQPFEKGGQRFIKLVLSGIPPVEVYDLEVVLDVKRNYLIQRFSPTTSSPDEVMRFESEVVSFREVLPGIYFPSLMVTKFYRVNSASKREFAN